MNTFLKQAYTLGAQQALKDFGITKLSGGSPFSPEHDALIPEDIQRESRKFLPYAAPFGGALGGFGGAILGGMGGGALAHALDMDRSTGIAAGTGLGALLGGGLGAYANRKAAIEAIRAHESQEAKNRRYLQAQDLLLEGALPEGREYAGSLGDPETLASMVVPSDTDAEGNMVLYHPSGEVRGTIPAAR